MKKLTVSNILFTIFLISLNINISAQQIIYMDDYYGQYATSDSRVVTTITEFENSDEVHIEALLIGALNIGVFQINLHYDPTVVVPTMGPGGEEITEKLNGTGNALGDYIWFNPELPNVANWRSSATGQVNPHVSAPWTYIMAGGNEMFGTNMMLEEGNILPVFKIFFKKLPGKILSNDTFSYYEKLITPQVRNFFMCGLGYVYMSGDVNNVNTFLDTDVFSRRIPSSVTTGNANVKSTHVTLKGIANSEGLPKIPAVPNVSSGLDWDTIVTTGFIYTKSDINITIDEYSNKIKMNDVEYDFPQTDGSFILGTDTLFMVLKPNTNRDSRIEMSHLLTDLEPNEQYYTFAFMKYKFQTSNEYPVVGERTGFETTLPEINFDINATTVTCNNEPFVNVAYNINVEEAQYKLLFGSEGMAAGFVNVTEYTDLPDLHINIALPQDLQAGTYAATVYISYGNWEENYDIVIMVNSLPEVTAVSEAEIVLSENEELYLFVEATNTTEYQWYFEDNIINGANESYYLDTYDAVREGTYSVSISNECGSLLHFFNVKKTEPTNSITENESAKYKVRVYPNPARKGETVSFLFDMPENVTPETSVQIFDMDGRKIGEYQLNDYRTEVSLNYAEGTYLVKVRTKNGHEMIGKIIIQ
jgi:hypothetical protein